MSNFAQSAKIIPLNKMENKKNDDRKNRMENDSFFMKILKVSLVPEFKLKQCFFDMNPTAM